MRSIVRASWLAALALVVSSQANAAVVTYNDFNAWQAAVGGASYVHKEFFDDATLEPWLQIVSDCDITDCMSPQGVSGGSYVDRVDSSPTLETRWELTFPGDVIGAGAFWDLAGPGGPGIGIDLYTSGGTFVGSIANSFSGGFFGFVSTVPFTEVRVRGGSQEGAFETYSISELDAAAVPEPGTLLLLGSGLTGLALRRRRRKK